MYPLAPNGIFWTVQGEGVLTGEPMAFVRLAGCSVGCAQCDTDYRVSRRLSVEDIVREVQGVVPKAFTWPWVWITGGEPTDHDLGPLVDALRTVGCRVALCTSGVKPVTVPVQWISVSPHSVDGTVQRSGHELKIVPGLNGLPWADVERMASWHFPYRYVQPLAWMEGLDEPGQDNYRNWCLDFVRRHPGWRMGIQAHKVWGVA